MDEAEAVHHIWHRGAAQLAIFLDDEDNEWFVEELQLTAEDFDWSVLSWALMWNHFHILALTRRATLSVGMQRLGLRHAKRNHARHGSAGHLYDAPYGQKRLTTDAHLLNLFKYIAANPVHAGLCDHPAGYRWSAHRALMNGSQATVVDAGRVAAFLTGIGNLRYADLFSDYPPIGDHWSDVRDPRPSVRGLLRQYGPNRGLAIARGSGYTVQELADETGLAKATVSRRSRGSKVPGTFDPLSSGLP